MPKSRRRKKAKRPPPERSASGIVNMTPEMRAAMDGQRAAFTAKFGREPGPGDPLFFDPDADTPTPITRERMEADLDEAFRMAGLDPAKAAAFKRRFL